MSSLFAPESLDNLEMVLSSYLVILLYRALCVGHLSRNGNRLVPSRP